MVKEELIIDGIRVELLESLNPNLTFNIADIAKPDTRKSDFSKTITLPGSKTINKIFEHSFEVNLALQTFNPNLKTSVVYLVDGEINIDGYLQLKQINITDTDDIIYEVTITGRIGDFITDIGNSYLTDLDLSSLNHAYTKANQLATWVNPITLHYVYPMVNYDVNYGATSNPETWTVEDFYPAITVWKYLNEIFDAADYTYTSTFIDSAFFKTLIVPFSAADFKLTSTQIDNRTYNANTPEWLTSGNANFTINESTQAEMGSWGNSQGGGFQSDRIVFTNEVSDAGSNYDPATGIFTVPENGYYSFSVDVRLNATYSPTGASEEVDIISALVGYLELRNYYGGGSSYNILDTSDNTAMIYESTAHATASSAEYKIPASSTGTTAAAATFSLAREYRASPQSGVQYAPSGFTIVLDGTRRNIQNTYVNVYSLRLTNYHLTAGDEVSVYGNFMYAPLKDQINITSYPDGTGITNQLFKGVSGAFYVGTVTTHLQAGTVFNQVANPSFLEGNTITMNSAIPQKIKQKDFFMSIVKMFNLYVQTDTSNDRNLIIEPKEDFYLDGSANVVDWSLKLDNSKQLEVLPMAALDGKDYLYNYKQDKDYYNKLYEDTWGKIYGEKLYDEFVNDFLTNTKSTNIIFSPTPSVGQSWYDRVIPTIIKADEDGNNVQKMQSNIRILQWGGLKTTAQQWFHRDWSDINAGTDGTSTLNYPYAGMYNDPYSPSIDIGFGLTREIYWDNSWGTITLTNNNLFNKYYKKFIEEITDKDSKIVKGWFYLRPTDIRDLSFRKLFWFENAYFRLNKIENYNPQSPITKCEFFKVKDVDVFTPTTAIANGGYEIFDGLNMPGFGNGNAEIRNRNSIGNLNVSVRGTNNYVNRNSANIEILGDNNNVFGGSRNVSIQGSGNTILAGVENVSLINTNDMNIAISNVIYINDIIQGRGSFDMLTISANADESITTYLGDTSGGNVILTLLQEPTIGKTWIAKKTDAANTFQLRVSGGGTIDGSATKNLTSLNESVTVQFDGTNYIII